MKTPLSKPNRGEQVISRKPRAVFMIFLVLCIVSLFHNVFVLPQAVRDVFPTLVAQPRVGSGVVRMNRSVSWPDVVQGN